MKRVRFRTFVLTLFVAIFPLVLSGCTPEKAQALLTAAKGFQAQADTALVSIENLFVEANRGLPQTREQAINKFINQAKGAVDSGATISTKEVIDRLGKISARKTKALINKEFSDLRQYYSAFADSLISLPQGSFFAADGVACTVDIAVRLTGSLVNYAKSLKGDPILAKRKISALRGQLVRELKKASPDGAVTMSLTRRLDQLIQDGFEDNNEAIRLLLIAADQGNRVASMASQYDNISISDILGGIQRGLSYAGTVKGLNTDSALNRLVEIKGGLEKDKYWKRILKFKVHQPSDKCKLEGVKT